jgi:hypothetical protein
MRDASRFVEFHPQDLDVHMRRVASKDSPTSRLLKIPMIALYGDLILLTDMQRRKAPATEGGSGCTTTPFYWATPEQINNASGRLKTLMIDMAPRVLNVSRKMTKKQSTPLGIYRDYPSDHGGEPTTVTVLPAIIDIPTNRREPKTKPGYVYFRGETRWVDIDEARLELDHQADAKPDNPLAQDTASIVHYTFKNLFEVVRVDDAPHS